MLFIIRFIPEISFIFGYIFENFVDVLYNTVRSCLHPVHGTLIIAIGGGRSAEGQYLKRKLIVVFVHIDLPREGTVTH